MLQFLKNILSPNGENSDKSSVGEKATRLVAVDEITNRIIWFEIVKEGASDLGFKYAIPRYHLDYSEEQREMIEQLSENDGKVYRMTCVSENEDGTAWRLVDLEEVGELKEGLRVYRPQN